MSQPPVLHKGCNSSTCCSPAKLWRTLQTFVKDDDKKGLIHFFKDARLEHIVRAALTSRISNDASLYPPSQQHKIIRLTSRESLLCLGKSYTDLNLLQLALLTSSESMVLTVLAQLKAHATQAQLKQFVNHIWGQGNTSLHLAVFLKRYAVVKALVDLGCSLSTLKNARNKTAMDCCLGDPLLLDLFNTKQSIVKKVEPITTTPPIEIPVQASKEQVQVQVQVHTPKVRNTHDLVVLFKRVYHLIPHDFLIDKKNLSILVQPNHCIHLAQLKKPPDIQTIVTF